MTDPPTPLAPQVPPLILDENAAPEVLNFVHFLATARALTPAQLALVTRYAALSPTHQSLVDDLVRELGKLP